MAFLLTMVEKNTGNPKENHRTTEGKPKGNWKAIGKQQKPLKHYRKTVGKFENHREDYRKNTKPQENTRGTTGKPKENYRNTEKAENQQTITNLKTIGKPRKIIGTPENPEGNT